MDFAPPDVDPKLAGGGRARETPDSRIPLILPEKG
jgi:hypothetical protein